MDNNDANNLPMYFRSNSLESNYYQPSDVAHTSMLLPGAESDRLGNTNFQRRAADGSRLLRDNLTTVIREIQPLVETARSVNVRAMSLSSFLNRPASYPEPIVTNEQHDLQNDSFVINLDNVPINRNNPQMHAQSSSTVNINGNTHGAENALNNNSGENGGTAETLHTVLEAQQSLQIIQRYVPFILVILAKGLYDHREGILNLIILFMTFSYGNSVVKKEATKQSKRSLSKLLIALLYIVACLIFIEYIFHEEKFYLSFILTPLYKEPQTIWDLVWIVGLADFILKLITVMVKIFLTFLPGKLILFQKRGKVYLFIEAASQLYRSLATIQPWLYYLLETYQGAEKVVGVFLSAAYMVSKGGDLMSRLRLFKTSAFKLLQNVTLGSSPSKDQIQTAGNHCPICHDEYDAPVLLQCRHIFCEGCVSTWFDREQTCPLCRAKIVDDPSWRDGSTTYFMQLF